MKKQLLPVVLCLVVLIFFTITMNQVEGSTKKELEEIVSVVEKNDIILTYWHGYLKSSLGEAQSLDQVMDIVESTKEKLPFVVEWKEYNEKTHHFTIEGTIEETTKIIKRIQIYAYNSNGIYNLFLNIELKGDRWNKEADTAVINQIKTILHQEQEYYTVTGMLNKKVDQQKFAQKIMGNFQVDYVEGISEDDFLSISGYKNNWESTITSSKDKEINFQLGLRYNQDKNLTNVTIGTPIIVKEY